MKRILFLALVTFCGATNAVAQNSSDPVSRDTSWDEDIRTILEKTLAEEGRDSLLEVYYASAEKTVAAVLDAYALETNGKEIPAYLCDSSRTPEAKSIIAFSMLRLLYNPKLKRMITLEEFIADSANVEDIFSSSNPKLFYWFGGGVLEYGYPIKGSDLDRYNHVSLRTSLVLSNSYGERYLSEIIPQIPFMMDLLDEYLEDEHPDEPEVAWVKDGVPIKIFKRAKNGKEVRNKVAELAKKNALLAATKRQGGFCDLAKAGIYIKPATYKKVPITKRVKKGKKWKTVATGKTRTVCVSSGSNSLVQKEFGVKLLELDRLLKDESITLKVTEAFPPTTKRHVMTAHYTGFTIDAGILGCAYAGENDAMKIKTFIECARKVGLKAVFETANMGINLQVLSLGVPSTNVRFFQTTICRGKRVCHITGSHFSVYYLEEDQDLAVSSASLTASTDRYVPPPSKVKAKPAATKKAPAKKKPVAAKTKPKTYTKSKAPVKKKPAVKKKSK